MDTKQYAAMIEHLKAIINDPILSTEVKHSMVFERGLADSLAEVGLLDLDAMKITASNRTEMDHFLAGCEVKLEYLQSIGVK